MSVSTEELQALGKIEGRLGRLEALQEATMRTTTELTANVNRLVEKLDRSDDIAREADRLAKSAHQRVDELGKQLEGQVRAIDYRIDTEQRERKADRRFMIATTLTAVSVTAGVATLILRMVGS